MLFERNCGATTGYSTQISVVEAGDQPSGTGNVFVADDDGGAAQAQAWGGPWAEMIWLAPDRVLVKHDAKSRIFKQGETMLGVQVSFQPVTRRLPLRVGSGRVR